MSGGDDLFTGSLDIYCIAGFVPWCRRDKSYLSLETLVHGSLQLVTATQVPVEDALTMTPLEFDNDILTRHVLVQVEPGVHVSVYVYP